MSEAPSLLDQVFIDRGFIINTGRYASPYELRLDDRWSIGAHRTYSPSPNITLRLERNYLNSPAGTEHIVTNINKLDFHIETIIDSLKYLYQNQDLLKCPSCNDRFVHVKYPRAGARWPPFLSCDGMRVMESIRDVGCRGTSEKIKPIVYYQ